MKKQVKLPSGVLGYLNQINIDLEMKAKHYDLLTTVTGDHYEEAVLSILSDLMDEDPYQLTQIDLMYVFTLVKIASIGDKLTVPLRCPNTLVTKSGSYRVCGAKQKFEFSIAESDDVKFYSGTLPEFTLSIGDKEETFSLKLPSMSSEIELLSELEAEGKTRKEVLLQNKQALNTYSKKRLVAHILSNNHTPAELYAALENSSYKKILELTSKVKDLNSYGLVHTTFNLTCKECGGTFVYRLPLFFGLSL